MEHLLCFLKMLYVSELHGWDWCANISCHTDVLPDTDHQLYVAFIWLFTVQLLYVTPFIDTAIKKNWFLIGLFLRLTAGVLFSLQYFYCIEYNFWIWYMQKIWFEGAVHDWVPIHQGGPLSVDKIRLNIVGLRDDDVPTFPILDKRTNSRNP